MHFSGCRTHVWGQQPAPDIHARRWILVATSRQGQREETTDTAGAERAGSNSRDGPQLRHRGGVPRSADGACRDNGGGKTHMEVISTGVGASRRSSRIGVKTAQSYASDKNALGCKVVPSRMTPVGNRVRLLRFWRRPALRESMTAGGQSDEENTQKKGAGDAAERCVFCCGSAGRRAGRQAENTYVWALWVLSCVKK